MTINVEEVGSTIRNHQIQMVSEQDRIERIERDFVKLSNKEFKRRVAEHDDIFSRVTLAHNSGHGAPFRFRASVHTGKVGAVDLVRHAAITAGRSYAKEAEKTILPAMEDARALDMSVAFEELSARKHDSFFITPHNGYMYFHTKTAIEFSYSAISGAYRHTEFEEEINAGVYLQAKITYPYSIFKVRV